MESKRLRLRPGLCDLGQAEWLWLALLPPRQPCISLQTASCRVPTVPEGWYLPSPEGVSALQLSCCVPGAETKCGWAVRRERCCAGKYIL